MSRLHHTVSILPARNGFIVEPFDVTKDVGRAKSPYVFESFGSMVKWLEENYCEGEQPSDNGAV